MKQAIYLTIFFLVSTITVVAADPVALVVLKRGASEVISQEGSVRPALLGHHVYEGDTLQTARGSELKMIFLDGTEVSLQENSDFFVEKYDWKEGVLPSMVAKVTQSVFFFLVGEMAKERPEGFRIESETATIGIRGSGGFVTAQKKTESIQASLSVRPVKGHTLVITPHGKSSIVLSDPLITAVVDSEKEVTFVPYYQETKEKQNSHSGSSPWTFPVPWFLPRRESKKNSSQKKGDLAKSDVERIYKEFEEKLHFPTEGRMRDLDDFCEKEKGSPRRVLASAKNKQQKLPKDESSSLLQQREIKEVQNRDLPEARDVLKELSKEQMIAKHKRSFPKKSNQD